ncbi:hypothetical protein T484DRAFT_1914343 [Baffinella frigidus]|nr:hypothetical protein T484DRAFT_1914343 [Cryptophyta sp. CCMP2293]
MAVARAAGSAPGAPEAARPWGSVSAGTGAGTGTVNTRQTGTVNTRQGGGDSPGGPAPAARGGAASLASLAAKVEDAAGGAGEGAGGDARIREEVVREVDEVEERARVLGGDNGQARAGLLGNNGQARSGTAHRALGEEHAVLEAGRVEMAASSARVEVDPGP